MCIRIYEALHQKGPFYMGIPDTWSNMILDVSMRAFSDETNICMGSWNKADALPSVRVGLIQLTESWYQTQGASLVAQMIKNLPARQETQVQSLG